MSEEVAAELAKHLHAAAAHCELWDQVCDRRPPLHARAVWEVTAARLAEEQRRWQGPRVGAGAAVLSVELVDLGRLPPDARAELAQLAAGVAALPAGGGGGGGGAVAVRVEQLLRVVRPAAAAQQPAAAPKPRSSRQDGGGGGGGGGSGSVRAARGKVLWGSAKQGAGGGGPGLTTKVELLRYLLQLPGPAGKDGGTAAAAAAAVADGGGLDRIAAAGPELLGRPITVKAPHLWSSAQGARSFHGPLACDALCRCPPWNLATRWPLACVLRHLSAVGMSEETLRRTACRPNRPGGCWPRAPRQPG